MGVPAKVSSGGQGGDVGAPATPWGRVQAATYLAWLTTLHLDPLRRTGFLTCMLMCHAVAGANAAGWMAPSCRAPILLLLVGMVPLQCHARTLIGPYTRCLDHLLLFTDPRRHDLQKTKPLH